MEGEAVALLAERLAPDLVAAIHLFFPDPLPKRAHHGRRFVRPEVIDLVVDRLTSGGSILLAPTTWPMSKTLEVLGGHPGAAGRGAERTGVASPRGYERRRWPTACRGRPALQP